MATIRSRNRPLALLECCNLFDNYEIRDYNRCLNIFFNNY